MKYCYSTLAKKSTTLATPIKKIKVELRGKSQDYIAYYTVFCKKDYLCTRFKNSQRPMVILDLGANVGFSSIFLSDRFPNATIYAVEPEKDNFKSLLKNTKYNKNIIPINAAIWSKNKLLKKASDVKNSLSFNFIEIKDFQQTESSHGVNYIDSLSIDNLCKNYGIGDIDIIKMDIEGGEKEVFSTNTQWLDKTSLCMIEIHHGCWQSVFKALHNINYDASIKGEVIHIYNLDNMIKYD